MHATEVRHLHKYYTVHHKAPGLMGSVRSFFRRQYRVVRAVEDISFTIDPERS